MGVVSAKFMFNKPEKGQHFFLVGREMGLHAWSSLFVPQTSNSYCTSIGRLWYTVYRAFGRDHFDMSLVQWYIRPSWLYKDGSHGLTGSMPPMAWLLDFETPEWLVIATGQSRVHTERYHGWELRDIAILSYAPRYFCSHHCLRISLARCLSSSFSTGGL